MKKVLSLAMLIFLSTVAFAQGEKAIMFGAGLNKFSGDIGGSEFSDIFKNDMGFGGSAAFRYVFPFRLGLRAFAEYDVYRGKDAEPSSETVQHIFNSNVFSVGGQLEFILWGNNYLEKTIPHSIYIFGGAKKAFVNSLLDDVLRAKESTGGYFGGVGYHYRINETFALGVEMKQIMFFSDNIDGYNPHHSSNKNKDTAFDVKLTFSYFIPGSTKTKGRWELLGK